MAEKTTLNAELTIEYPNYDDYDVTNKQIDATIIVEGDEWRLDGDGFEDVQTFRVIEERDKIMVAPVGEYGVSTTQTADYEPGVGRVEPQYLKHEGKYVKAIIGDAIDETLGEMVSEARNRFVSERGIQSAGEFDIPDIELRVKEGQPLFPSSKTGRTMAPRDRLVVEPKSDDVAFGQWQNAIVETTNRYEVWAGTSSKGTDELLAPKGYEAGDTLTLSEYLDAFYTVNPQAVKEAATPDPNPMDEVTIDTNVDTVTDLETTETVTGTIEGDDETREVSVDISVVVEPCDFYNDGRLVRTVQATLDAGEGELTTSLKKKTDLHGNSVSYSTVITELDRVPDHLCEEFGKPNLRIDDWDAQLLAAMENKVEDVTDTARKRLQTEHDMNLSVDSQWGAGDGEGHAIHARGAVTFADGRELLIHWRNAVDIGHQVFTGEDSGTGSELQDFDDIEVDAAVALAQSKSPITQSMRM